MNRMDIDDKTKINRLEQIISIYESKVFEFLYEKIVYCNICKDINKDTTRCMSLKYCRNHICKTCFINNKLQWICDKCK
jgi:hypothetical protein